MAIIDIFLHLDQHLAEWVQYFGPWIYVILFLIIFAETGLIITPILPGDSLLFAVGAIAAIESANLHIGALVGLMITAAILGDFVNYSIGKALGPKVFSKEKSLFFNRQHLLRTEAFYERHGNKTIVIARFMPIIRTFAPFVAGIGRMHYQRFIAFNILGGILWVASFTLAGYHFGNIDVIKRNFHIVIFAVIFLSVLPVFIGWLKSRSAPSNNA